MQVSLENKDSMSTNDHQVIICICSNTDWVTQEEVKSTAVFFLWGLCLSGLNQVLSYTFCCIMMCCDSIIF